jgi:hypothetical protein
MTRITENIIEAFAIELLTKLGYDYIYARISLLIRSGRSGILLGMCFW